MATEKSYELCDLPVEMQKILVEKCDLISRCKLRASSASMSQVVDSAKLLIPIVKIKDLSDEGVLIKLTMKRFQDEYSLKFRKNETGGTRICQAFQKEIHVENSIPMDEGFDFFKRMCVRKNVTIGQIQFECKKNEVLKKKFEKVINDSDTPLKIRSIYWSESELSDLLLKLMERCDKTVLKNLKVIGKAPEGGLVLFGKNDEILNNLERLEVECNSNSTDENVLALNASVIALKSDNFTSDMTSRLIEKFTKQRSKGSSFQIETSPSKNLYSSIIPEGFEEDGVYHSHTDYINQLEQGEKSIVLLRVNESLLRLQIGNEAHFWVDRALVEPPDYDDSSSDYDLYDDFDEVQNDFYGNGFDTDPEYDFYDQNEFDESDFDDDYEDDDIY